MGGDTMKAPVAAMEAYLEEEILPQFMGRSIISTFMLEMAIQDAGLPEEIEKYAPKAQTAVLNRAMKSLGARVYSRVRPNVVNAWVLPVGKVRP